MRKPDFCICENKDADQLRGDREADQRLCFRYIDSTLPLLSKYEMSCRFVSDLVGNPEDRFSQNEAHISVIFGLFKTCHRSHATRKPIFWNYSFEY